MLKSVSISLSDVFKLIRQNLEHTGNVKAQVEYDLFSVMKILMLGLLQEERGAYFGRVFALLAVVQSGQLEEPVSKVIVCSFRI